MTTHTRKYLSFWDIVLLSLILFGTYIYQSSIAFFNLQGFPEVPFLFFSSDTNLQMLTEQGIKLGVALCYLLIRRFDFKQWRFHISLKSTLIAISLFAFLALAMDALFFAFETNFKAYVTSSPLQLSKGLSSALALLSQPTLVLYALFNGLYEELYFIGICTAVKKDWRLPVFAFSLLVRLAFHTYQGFLSALGIALFLGVTYRLFYHKTANLYPIVLSHALADIFGLSLLYYLFGWG